MNTEIPQHAERILRGEPTRTSNVRALHQRVAAELRMGLSYARFLELLVGQPDRFAMVTEGDVADHDWRRADAPLDPAWLERAGAARGTTVVLIETAATPELDELLQDDVRATLAAAHAAVLDLLISDRGSLLLDGLARDAVLELDQLRVACPELKRGAR